VNKCVFKPFLHIAPTELKIFVGCFSINITLLRSLKALILLGFMKKPTLENLPKGDQGGCLAHFYYLTVTSIGRIYIMKAYLSLGRRKDSLNGNDLP
jgi:hypothetical protein